MVFAGVVQMRPVWLIGWVALWTVCLGIDAAWAQDESASASSVASSTDVVPGVGWVFEYAYRKTKEQADKPREDGSSSVVVEVLEVDDSGVVFKWHQVLPEPAAEDQSLAARVIRAGDFEMHIKADPTWGQLEIINFKDVHQHLLEVAQLTWEMVEPDTAIEHREVVRSGMIEMFEDPAFAYSTAIKPVSLFTLGLGWTGVRDQVRESEVELPNPLGGPALPGLMRVKLSVGEADDRTRWDYSQRFDPERVGPVIESFMARFLPPGDEALADAKSWTIDLSDDATAVIDDSIRFVREVRFQRRFRVELPARDSGERVEIWSWELVKATPPADSQPPTESE